MRFQPFHIEKPTQAAAALLGSEPSRSMERLRLMKLLYMANRKMLKQHGRPIFPATAVAMKHGPLFSEIYSAVQTGGVDDPFWADNIQNEGPRVVRLIGHPGGRLLSRDEIEVLSDTLEEMAGYSTWDVVEITHTFPEWKKHYPDPDADTSRVIPVRDILEALELSSDAEAILAEMDEQAEFDRLFTSRA